MSITSRIDAITDIPVQYRNGYLPAPKSVKIELTAQCNYHCLRGDTLVDTIYGRIPIKELAENFETVPVFTYKDGEVFVADAINIRKTGKNKAMVRVLFDDDTHIDCTPDHRFLQFKRAGARPSVEWVTEAQDLEPGSSVRAYRENMVGGGYIDICWGRQFKQKRYRMVMEYLMGRKLSKTEQVHHKDHNRTNDYPDNLEYVAFAKEHFDRHPEIAERMRADNPIHKMTTQQREELAEKLRQSNIGKTRTLEQRLRYRESKLGDKNPNFIDGSTARDGSRIAEVNHKVVKVFHIEAMEDVYCLEVPETGWFFANKVLVKNCQFCVKSLRPDDGAMDHKMYSRIIRELRDAGVEELGLFYIGESFTLKWLPQAIAEAKKVGFPYVFLTTNGSAATPERVTACMGAGLDSLKFSLNFADSKQLEEVARVDAHYWQKSIDNLKAARKIRDEGHFHCGIYASSIAFDGEQGVKMKALVDEVKPFLDEHYWLPLYGMGGASKAAGWVPKQGNPGRLDALRDSLPCWAVFTEGHITKDGLLAACCFGSGIDGDLIMEDLKEVSFLKGWNSPKFVELRKAHLERDVSMTACAACAAGD